MNNRSPGTRLRSAFLIAGLPMAIFVRAAPGEDRWWPKQTLPEAMVRTTNQQEFPAARFAVEMMVQSVAGLAAKAVNEGRGDELVWVNSSNENLEDWYARFLAAHPNLKQRGTFGAWELVDRYAKRGIIKGYILYRLDQSLG